MHGDSPSSHVASQWQTIFQMVAIYYVAVLWFKDCVLGVWQDVLAHEYLGVGTWFKQVGLVPGAGIDEELRWPAIIGAAGVHTTMAMLGIAVGTSLKRVKNVFTGLALCVAITAVYALAVFHIVTYAYEENYGRTVFFANAFHYPTEISDASFYFGALATMHMTLWFGTAVLFASLDKESHGARYLPRVAMFYLASMVFFRFGCVPLWNYCCRFSFMLEGMFGSTLNEAIITQPDAFSKLASGTHTLTLVLGIVTCSVMNKVLFAIPCGRNEYPRKRKWNLTVLFTLITLFSTVFFQWVSFALRERVEHVVSFATIFAGEEAVSQAATALWSPVHTLVLGSYLSWFCFGVLFEQTWSDSATNRQIKEEGQQEVMPVIPITVIAFLTIFVIMPAAWIGGTIAFFTFVVLMWPSRWRGIRKSVIPPSKPFGSYLNCSWEKATEDCPRTGNTYLIVGVGFVGQRLVARLLERGETKIRAFDISPHNPWEGNPHVTYIRGNVCKSEDVAKAMKGVDIVITTFAAIRFWESLGMHTAISTKVNIDGTKVVLEEAKKAGVKTFVQTSTSNVMATPTLIAEYDARNGKPLVPMDESCPYATRSNTHNHYSWTKAAAEKLALDANDNDGMMTAACRPCSAVYGPKDKQLSERAFSSSVIVVMYDFKIDWIYVDDVVLGLLKAEARLNERDVKVAGQAFNIVPDGELRSYREVLDTFRHYATFPIGVPTKAPFYFLYLLGYIMDALQVLTCGRFKPKGDLELLTPACFNTAKPDFTCSNAKAKKLLNFHPVWTIEDGAQETVVAWERDVLKRERKVKSE
eukprot:TRINITY_DN364_c0_g1_i4.p1 TRINITY_DN364_c0_g1~~TRINITY_DN364_c0_g1_i4.p1  ORF type:complete len:826 (+),score=269.08 TRINITY_DN364_c0_g1_i4:50-2479(+)